MKLFIFAVLILACTASPFPESELCCSSGCGIQCGSPNPNPGLGRPVGQPDPSLGRPVGQPDPSLGRPVGQPDPSLGTPVGQPNPNSGARPQVIPLPRPGPGAKPGKCPDAPSIIGVCSIDPQTACNNDLSCSDGFKCCANGCGRSCVKAEVTPPLPNPNAGAKPGTCPPNDSIGICSFNAEKNCLNDNACAGAQKCCASGCNRSCVDVQF